MGNLKKLLKRAQTQNLCMHNNVKTTQSEIVLRQITDEELLKKRVSVYEYVL